MKYSWSSLLATCLVVAASSVSCPVFGDDAPSLPVDPAAAGPKLPAQTRAADNGPSPITLRLQYTGEAAENAVGGIHNGASYMNNILGQLHIDTGKAFGWTGGEFVLEGFYENADSVSANYVGAAQDPSVIDTSGVAMFRLYQAYYKQQLGNTNLLFGIYDLQTEFGSTRPMDIFFNGAYAWNTVLDKSGVHGPSTYPNTSLAFRIRQKLNDQWSIQAAVLDGVPDSAKRPNANAVTLSRNNGALLIAEVDYAPTRTTKFLAGYWDYTGRFDAINQFEPDGTQRQKFGSSGGYVGAATRLYSQTASRGLNVFANIGIGSATTQEVDRSFNAGLTYIGLLDSRPYDKMGIAVSLAQAGTAFKRMQVAAGTGVKSYETNFELTYRAPITSWLTIQPDIQYWINPGFNPLLKNDLLFLIHFEISHVFGL